MEESAHTSADGIRKLPPQIEESVKKEGGLYSIISKIPDAEAYEGEAEKFKALSAPVRLQIMHSLVVADLCPSILKQITHMSDSKLSYHLEILESAGLIVHIQSQKWRIYAITLEGRKAIGQLREVSDIPII